jgi:uncharacterized repeat protein (TIGR01451 family)
MKKINCLLTLSVTMMLVLSSCGFGSPATATEAPLFAIQSTAPVLQSATIELTVQPDTSIPLNTVGQVIKSNYMVKNTGTAAVAASLPTDITVTGAIATCPSITTVGNLDGSLDPGETIVCTGTYSITQADLDKGSVSYVSTAIVTGISSAPVTTSVPLTSVLKLAKTANPASYDHIGQSITYTYVITNSGTAALGPAQFIVKDAGIPTPINCGDAALTLAPNATVTCSATYTVSQADVDAATIATNAIASVAGGGQSQPASATVTKTIIAQTNPNPVPANLTVGSTIKYQVVAGDWLWQIARCYGADPNKVIQANTQIANPAQISPNTTVTVPNIGSAGKIYGPPCVGTHTVQSGDTWSSIALKYNADLTVLQMVNPKTLTPGAVLKIPLNSAGITSPTGTTGYCVDVTRPLKLVNMNAVTTHFNVCGAPDPQTSGNMKISTVKVYQRVEDVPGGAPILSQDITLPASVTTSTAINNATSLIVGDMNYDGNDDFRIVEFLPAGPNIPYIYYLYDQTTRTFVYNEGYRKITSPEFPGNAQIISKWRESATKWGIDTYTITNNVPLLTKRETWEVIANTTNATHQVTEYHADGTNTMTVNETIPTPLQP